MSDLQSIIDGDSTPVEETPQVEETQVEAEPEATVEPVAEEPVAEPVAQEEPKMVPLAALTEVRRELQEMKQRLPQPPAPQAPDIIDDQQGYQQFLQTQVGQQVQNAKLDMSEEMARGAHGDETVDAAFAAFQAANDPSLVQELMAARSPWNEVVKWHARQTVAQEIGSDPAAYKAKVEAEVRAKVEAEMVAKQARDNAGKFAPSMANVTGTGGGPKTTWAGPTPLDQAIG